MPHSPPDFRDLARVEVVQMLREHRFGRLAFTFHDHVDVEPIHYMYHRGWLYGRTAPGTKLSVLAHHPWVAFEIDQVRDDFSWRSVVVKGTVYYLEPGGVESPVATYRNTVRIIRRLWPKALTPDDPVPSRTVLLRIHIDTMSGRAANWPRPRRRKVRR